jgi:hypothetical protein
MATTYSTHGKKEAAGRRWEENISMDLRAVRLE